MSAMYSHDDLMRLAKDAGPFFADNARQSLQWAARTLAAADEAVTAERARAESAEAERDRLIAEVARQVEARDDIADSQHRLISELCAARSERNRLRDALRKLRDAVIEQNRSGASWHPHVFGQMMSGLSDAAVLLDIDAAAKGNGSRCCYCDDTGDVHSPDGQWRGSCSCPAGTAAKGQG